jgi:hypothetical protein
MTATVEHTVISAETGEPVGIIESTWDTMAPGEFLLDGCPAASVLLSMATYGNVPRAVAAVFNGNGSAGDYRLASRFSVVPRRTC